MKTEQQVAMLLAVVMSVSLIGGAMGFQFTAEEREIIRALVNQSRRDEAEDMIQERMRWLEARKNQTQRLVRRNFRELMDPEEAPTTTPEKKIKACQCSCDPDNIELVTSAVGEGGYGRYCGVGFTCKGAAPACDAVDACCQIHDACVHNSGYCGSCKCNVALSNCIAAISNSVQGFAPCNQAAKARENIRENICLVIDHAPELCGGCDDSEEALAHC